MPLRTCVYGDHGAATRVWSRRREYLSQPATDPPTCVHPVAARGREIFRGAEHRYPDNARGHATLQRTLGRFCANPVAVRRWRAGGADGGGGGVALRIELRARFSWDALRAQYAALLLTSQHSNQATRD